MSDSDVDRLAAAEALLRGGRVGQAVGALRALLAERPDLATAHSALASALEASGDRIGAERALRAALAADPTSAEAATKLANILTSRGQAPEAVELLAPFVDTPAAEVMLLTSYGAALKVVRRNDEAVEAYAEAVRVAPDSAAAQHNLAGALGEANRFAESEAAMRRGFAMGLDAPESWLVLGRALLGQGEFDQAETALREAFRRRPTYADAHAELAQLIWMRTEDIAQATEAMDITLRVYPDAGLYLARAKVLEFAGDVDAAYASLADILALQPGNPELLVAAALLIVSRDGERALEHAERAFAAAPASGPPAAALCQATLALGRADLAAPIAEKLCRDWPLDQHPLTLAATAWRLQSDPRYGELYDYDRFVRTQTIATPAGWPSLEAYLADLAASLRALQRLPGHPIGQSIRHGAQTGQSLTLSDDPVIKAFFAAIDEPITRYIADLAGGGDPLGRRVTSGYRFAGAWSVLLRPGGRHVDHIHPLGWISSAFHVELPEAIEHDHQGWLKFGEPGVPTSPVLGPEHFIKPRAGDLVLFPSYMWHGTVPFAGDAPRLAIAFDLLPK